MEDYKEDIINKIFKMVKEDDFVFQFKGNSTITPNLIGYTCFGSLANGFYEQIKVKKGNWREKEVSLCNIQDNLIAAVSIKINFEKRKITIKN